jgi:hypothetical protein
MSELQLSDPQVSALRLLLQRHREGRPVSARPDDSPPESSIPPAVMGMLVLNGWVLIKHGPPYPCQAQLTYAGLKAAMSLAVVPVPPPT